MRHIISSLSLIFISLPLFGSLRSETSISLLRGGNFELGEKYKTELTVEQASTLKYGDSFFWLDITDSMPKSEDKSKITELYGEWAPRLSLGKLFSFYKKERIVQDFLISSALEFGNNGNSTRSKLYGLGIDLNISYFTYFNLNLYVRDNLRAEGQSTQLSISYSLQKALGSFNINYSSYIDIVRGEEGSVKDSDLVESHWHTAQQLLLDIGPLFNAKFSHSIYMGIEYQYWNRKFGIKGGPVENNLKWMLKWIL